MMATNLALSMEHVYKKFRRGEHHDSLRDLIPALARRAVRSMVAAPALEESEFWGLQDISFEVQRGESVAVIGHNGAGKSTLLTHLSGLLQPTRGTITVNGRLSALIEVTAGFHPDLTGRENVFLNGAILGMSRKEVQSKFDEIVEFSGLADFIDTPVKRYSSGMFARLGFSVAAHMEPEILIIDEVLSVGDHVFQAKCVEKMKGIARRGTTVFFVSHNIRSVLDLCQRALFLEHGKLIQDGPTSEVVHTYMSRSSAQSMPDEARSIRIESVEVSVDGQVRYDVEAGEAVDITVVLRGVQGADNVSCLIALTSQEMSGIFHVTSEDLGEKGASIRPGDVKRYRFRLDAHLGPGTYYATVMIYRVDASDVVEEIPNAATIYVTGARAGGGFVQLYPRLVAD
jgi:ABC-type polysaccharide/polyol phosphate transport system ATPase subunit